MTQRLHLYAVALALLCAGGLHGQAATPAQKQPAKPASQEQSKADAHKLPAERGDVVDRIVATVNGDLVLESDLEQEERFTKFYPYGSDQGAPLRQQALKRLIDRTLIEQQMAGYPQQSVSNDQINKDESELRKDLPACAHADCDSDAGWKQFLTNAGFTDEELRSRIKQRIQVLHFIEQRFRAGVRISDKQTEDFYTNTMLPEYAKQHATAPPLDSVRDRINELLLQQQVSSLLDDWLKTLRDSGRVRILRQGEEAP